MTPKYGELIQQRRGELIQQRRKEKNLTCKQLVEKVGVRDDFNVEILEDIERGFIRGFSTCLLDKICDALDLDFGAMLQGRLEEKPTTLECLEALEPGGLGTPEQRAIRLYLHNQISQGRACEILGINRYDMPFKLDDGTGCTCPGCRRYCEDNQQYYSNNE